MQISTRGLLILSLSISSSETLAVPLSERGGDFLVKGNIEPQNADPRLVTPQIISNTTKAQPVPMGLVGGQGHDRDLIALPKLEDVTIAGEHFPNITALDDNTIRAVDSQVFYRWILTCPTPTQMIQQMPDDPAAYPSVGRRMRADFRNIPLPLTRAYGIHRMCMDCICDDQGSVQPNPARRGPSVSGQQVMQWWCQSDYKAYGCSVWYRCSCFAEMHQPPVERGNSIADYQDALNNIPLKVKQENSAYEWTPAERISMSWQYVDRPGADSSAAKSNSRYAIPGTQGEYYLEGPSQVGVDSPLSEYDSGLLGGHGIGSWPPMRR